MTKLNLTEIVRDAILGNGTKDEMFNEISAVASCDRHTAKQLMFSFLWFAEEERLQAILRGEY